MTGVLLVAAAAGCSSVTSGSCGSVTGDSGATMDGGSLAEAENCASADTLAAEASDTSPIKDGAAVEIESAGVAAGVGGGEVDPSSLPLAHSDASPASILRMRPRGVGSAWLESRAPGLRPRVALAAARAAPAAALATRLTLGPRFLAVDGAAAASCEALLLASESSAGPPLVTAWIW